jgi:hypothetical protein
LGFEKVEERSPPEVAPISKPEVPDTEPEAEIKMRTVRAKAAALLLQWSNLQEMFKIPKREMLAKRKAHEKEADRAAAAASEARPDFPSSRVLPSPKPVVGLSSYDRGGNHVSCRFSIFFLLPKFTP